MPNRRRFMTIALAVPLVAALPAAASLPAFHIVDGWVLTDADLSLLGLHAR